MIARARAIDRTGSTGERDVALPVDPDANHEKYARDDPRSNRRS